MTSVRSYSLVVLTRDRPVPLDRCLTSVANLAWEGTAPEVIVVDDGSSPPVAPDLPSRFPTLRLVLLAERNAGVASARNLGLRAATGTHVAFIADDYTLPATYLKDVDAFFNSHPDAQVISHNLAPRGTGPFSPVQRLYMQLALGQEFAGEIRDGVVSSFTLPAARAAVFVRTVFDRVGAFDEHLRTGEDGELSRRLAAAGIPVHMFFWKTIDHFEEGGLTAYLRQRVRYGQSFSRVLRPPRELADFRRWGAVGVGVCVARKMTRWVRISWNLGMFLRYLLLAPFLAVFLGFFYTGAFLGSRR
jgi:glycosyltransferase involved in cell wall biosynthesis